MQNRDHEVNEFLKQSIWANATRKPLNQDASFRQYTRLSLDGQSAMLMDAKPPEQPVAEFDRIAKHLHSLDIKAPQSIQISNDDGLLLLEDLGETTFAQALRNGESEVELYSMATDLLSHLHTQTRASSITLPKYDLGVLQQEAVLLPDWFYPYVAQSSASEQTRQSYQKVWEEVFTALDKPHETLVLRDYHIDNLMVIDENRSRQCAVLDFQDALLGHPAYDLVSLLEDARRDISEPLSDEMHERYFIATNFNKAAFMPWYHALGAQRHCKVLGIFVRLFERDAKPVYLQHLPRVVRLLQQCLAEPNLKPVKMWFEEHLDLNKLKLPLIS